MDTRNHIVHLGMVDTQTPKCNTRPGPRTMVVSRAAWNSEAEAYKCKLCAACDVKSRKRSDAQTTILPTAETLARDYVCSSPAVRTYVATLMAEHSEHVTLVTEGCDGEDVVAFRMDDVRAGSGNVVSGEFTGI